MKQSDPDQVVAFSKSSAGRKRALALIKRDGGPLYEADAYAPQLIVERLPDGSARRGRWLDGRFLRVVE